MRDQKDDPDFFGLAMNQQVEDSLSVSPSITLSNKQINFQMKKEDEWSFKN